ncbi:hypothetical protein EII34_10025 [Arachnia propionica]|uniref:Uncharacterized protein n=1 Tax=Arachnia propionica TaxID=1750 RepID=A0A3P1T7I3_9ACTN|nr:hypothetical protein [Arachnia propionica]RRD04393.1 hypothetical protein EII34_10025 [Arachnia propionica]
MTITIPALITRASSVADLAAQLEALPPDVRTGWTEDLQHSLASWQEQLDPGQLRTRIVQQGFDRVESFSSRDITSHERRQRLATRLVLVAVTLDATSEQVLSLFRRSTTHYLALDGGLPHVTRAMAARGTAWVEEFISGLRDMPGMVETASPLISRLLTALDLPIPDDPAYLAGFTRLPPGPGQRWQEHFLLACTVPDSFNHPEQDQQEHVATIRKAVATLRRTEPTDDDALLDGLLRVIERGERPGIQLEALAWIDGLGLDLTTESARVLAVLPDVGARIVVAFTRALLATELTDEQLWQLTAVVLPRREKHLKHEVLKRLATIEEPPRELVELVAPLAQTSDTTTAAIARKLLSSWCVSLPPPPIPRGLWRDPSLPASAPFPGVEHLVLDPVQLHTLVQETRRSWQNDVLGNWLLEERLLASLIATAHAHGPDIVVAACATLDPETALSPLATLLAQLGEGTLGLADLDDDEPVALGTARQHSVLLRLGELPTLLSTPSTDRWLITRDDLRARITRYHDAGVALDPADLAVTLARLEPDGEDDLAGLDAPIHGAGTRLAEVLASWRGAGIAPARLDVDQWWTWNPDPIRVTGEVPPWHALLGFSDAPGQLTGHLQPHLMARPSVEVLTNLTRSGPAAALERLVPCLAVAQRCDEPLMVATLATVAIIQPKARTIIAAALLEAWDQGRLKADDLVEGWQSPLWDVLRPENSNLRIERVEGRVLTLLTALTELGGVALAWPLLVAIAEELAAADRISSVAPSVLETVHTLLPEAHAARVFVELPNVVALADRDEKLKSIITARAIKERL